MTMPLPPYKGTEPYIFISYAHRDSDRVFPIIRRLQDDSCRVWYDDGIDPGTEWDENIAKYINGCSVFIAFLSENYIASKNCKDELSYSRDIDKNQILIYLEDLTLPDGLKMRLNRLQAIFWYRYPSTDAACSMLYGAPGLNQCRAPEPEPPAAAPRSAAEDVPAQTEQENPPGPGRKPGRRKAIWIIAAVLALAGIITAAVIIRGTRQKGTEGSEPAEVSETAEPEPEPPADEETNASEADAAKPVHVILTADEEMTVRDFPAAVETLKGRLDILTEGEEYQLTVDGDTVDLWIPKDCLAGDGLEYTLRCYLTRAINLYAVSDTGAKHPISRKEVERVTLLQGAVPGADSEKLTANGIEGETYSYIELVLTDEGAARLAEASGDWENGVSIGQDADQSYWYYYYTVPAEDGKTFYLINGDQEERFSRLLEYNLTHDPLAHSFSYMPDLDVTTQWERVEEPDALAGQNQCNEDEFTEQTMIFTMKGYNKDYTGGEWYDLNAALKERLDALEIPYAFALRVENDQTIATVKCPLRHMGPGIIRILGEKFWKVRSGLTERSLYSVALTRRDTDSGTCEIELQSENESGAEDLNAVLKAAADEGGDVYLVLGDVPCMQTTVSEATEDGKTTFDRCALLDGGQITQNEAWLANLLDTIWNGTPLSTTFEMQFIQYIPGPDGTVPTDEDCEIVEKESGRIVQAIEKACPEAEVYTNDSSTVYVQLHLAIDDSLPEKSLDLAEKIYRSFDFKNATIDGITIYLTDEDNEVKERGRIFFSKSYNSYDSSEPGYVYARGIFCNGRLEDHKEKMQELVKNSAFFSELYVPGEYGFGEWTWEWN